MAKRSRDASLNNHADVHEGEGDGFPLVGRRTVERCTFDVAEAKKRFRESHPECKFEDDDPPIGAEIRESFRRSELPEWLEEKGWESDDYPIVDSREACCQWLDLAIATCQIILGWERERNEDLRDLAEPLLNDAHRLVSHFASHADMPVPPIAPAAGTAGMMHTYLKSVRDWMDSDLSGPPRPKHRKQAGTLKATRKRRRRSSEPKPLTAAQVEALQQYAECEGNMAEAARRIGIDRKSLEDRLNPAWRKLGTTASQFLKHKTSRLPTDRRGQESVVQDDDRRGI